MRDVSRSLLTCLETGGVLLNSDFSYNPETIDFGPLEEVLPCTKPIWDEVRHNATLRTTCADGTQRSAGDGYSSSRFDVKIGGSGGISDDRDKGMVRHWGATGFSDLILVAQDILSLRQV